MDHAWLDSLSEDWVSQHPSSGSPAPSLPSMVNSISSSTRATSSRIPRYNPQKQAWTAANEGANSPLSERSLNENNVPLSQRSQRQPSKLREVTNGDRGRRLSRTLSASTTHSVQYHTVQHKSHSLSPRKDSQETPEWRRRLIHGEVAYGEQRDLFSAAGLETIFQPPPANSPTKLPTREDDEDHSVMPSSPPVFDSQGVSVEGEHHEERPERHQQPRTMKYRLADSDGSEFSANDLSRGSSFQVTARSVRGNEEMDMQSEPPSEMESSVLQDRNVTNWPSRTASGQSDVRNEELSPIFISRHNTIDGKIDYAALNLPAEELQRRLENIREESPDQSVADQQDISEQQADMTVETEDFAHNGRFVNLRRGGQSQEGSFQRRMLSPSSLPAIDESAMLPEESMQASTPKHLSNIKKTRSSNEYQKLPQAQNSPPIPQTPSTSPNKPIQKEQQSSSGSPLKLFGTYDTFTNQKLLRRLSQFEGDFEDAESTGPENNEDFVPQSSADRISENSQVQQRASAKLNSFGQGDLDGFQFSEEVSYDSSRSHDQDEDKENMSLPLLDPESRNTFRFHLEPSPALEEEAGKRLQRTPLKDPTPKRRRTLQKFENETSEEDESLALDSLRETHQQMQSVIGRKRKDARHGDDQQAANPKVLAMRQILRPRTPTPSQRSSQHERPPLAEIDPYLEQARLLQLEKIAKIQAELDTPNVLKFSTAFGISQQMQNESRKGSVTTQDFLDEAKKIMAGIRDKVRPRSGLTSLEESESENDKNQSPGVEHTEAGLEDSYQESTKEPFSRPPSRDGKPIPRVPMKQEDPVLLDHLRKYQEMSDVDGIMASSMKSLALAKATISGRGADRVSEDAIPQPSDQFLNQEHITESDPPNIRISENPDPQRKRKHSTSSIPKDDPFGDIPDLSVDETQERQRIKSVNAKRREDARVAQQLQDEEAHTVTSGSQPVSQEQGNPTSYLDGHASSEPSKLTQMRSSSATTEPTTRLSSWGEENNPAPSETLHRAEVVKAQHKIERIERRKEVVEEVEKEISILEDRVDPITPSRRRNVTITFSSPVASVIRPTIYEDENSSQPEAEFASDSEDDSSEGSVVVTKNRNRKATTTIRSAMRSATHLQSLGGHTFSTRPVSRIDERDEDSTNAENEVRDRSSISIVVSAAGPSRREASMILATPRPSHEIGTLTLTPLSDFTVHHADQSLGLDVSYMAQNQRYVMGDEKKLKKKTLSHSIKTLIEKLTEVEPYEPFWEHLKRLDLKNKALTNLHKLNEFCGGLEDVDVSHNRLSQLEGIPTTTRHLRVTHNCLTELTAWGHLNNLQYIDVSNNDLESLSAFRFLAHLRDLTADNNNITSLDGVGQLDGLLKLSLRRNSIRACDFAGTKLQRLTELDLASNEISDIGNIQELQGLTTLNLEDNRLADLSTGGSDAVWPLRDLRLSGNELTTINVARFPNLRLLYLDRNRLGDITGLSRTRNLETLSIREQADGSILDLSFLNEIVEVRKLFLSGNYLGTFEPEVEFMNLQYLELANCGLNSLPSDFGLMVANVRVLNLNFNALKDLKPLLGIRRLKKLHLAGNRILRLRTTARVLRNFPSLTLADIRGNPLTVGFYPPMEETRLVLLGGDNDADASDPFVLGRADRDRDEKYVRRLDMQTRMLRRTFEILVLGDCPQLRIFDGLDVDMSVVVRKDSTWQALVNAGVLRLPSLEGSAPAEQREDDLALEAIHEEQAVRKSFGSSTETCVETCAETYTEERMEKTVRTHVEISSKSLTEASAATRDEKAVEERWPAEDSFA
ncbi:uncharacterized protein LY89DRAFT_635037 [Mollisia scopiformis]|uniref:Septation initiation network scaffold protein cdc11 n=1 Tax=Mollisia scopiformis TaxID=149040 RepID=A0A194XTE6_MOLSC|nr:uncharacterized protein LY89DRAFT_635037 [Mollisia scopiformis]KUJ22967.1 hypothetical protein LY89DRAFT_635037 [Mollisia scopiformis]